jgi:trk system potassium uptake protein TrkA
MIELGVPEGCRAAGSSLAQLDFPEGAIVGAVAREGEVLIPTGRDVLRGGDKVVVFTVESAVDEVERLFAT